MVILLVDEDLGTQFSIWKLLKSDGFTVQTAGDGKAALEVSRNYPGSIDLLLSDMSTRMGGLELCHCHTIAAERPGIKQLMMSVEVWGREQASTEGLPFLQKPFSVTALRNSIAALLGPFPPLR